MKVLLIEDNAMIGELTKKMLVMKRYQVDWLKTGDEVMEYLAFNSYDILLVDWMLPNQSGIEIIEQIRNENINVPIIMLTAKSQTADKVTGLTVGADDYVTKPFEFEELEARILAVMKRATSLQSNTKQLGNIIYYYQQHQFTVNDEVIGFSQKEYQLLELLFLNKIVSKELIIEKIWNIDQVVTNNNVDVLVKILRKKLKKVKATIEIKSIRGVGYKLEVMS
ncbi:response regulator transcription factor [Staphylococcus sp. NRL 16/872]|uniref:response regulator transcription factor n=1 Tax=Staphylococcus sp. NRL 16/872 TaxID=2930131 RepID=UPI001FB2CEBE|nr:MULTISPECIES: response regulator transcription factor [unclassified Staphylococcus]MCJ1655217.1 response regulator transcription factor [Staphylococcus sp. NRL 21/187]MCJ1666950.1 response regulator transcription factor [Staphylococcus sp. NRL 19/737]WEN69422.1 response regulator transcription factor [Staphylococcus sp. NRL 16/872]